MTVTVSAEAIAALDRRDRVIVETIATAHGALTVTQYSLWREVSRQRAHCRLTHPPLTAVFRLVFGDRSRRLPDVFCPTEGIVRMVTGDSHMPSTEHSLLDSVLRTHCAILHGGIWTHHARLPAVLTSGSGPKLTIHVLDCLDRSPSSVVEFAGRQQAPAGVVHIHTGVLARSEAMRRANQGLTAALDRVSDQQTPLTWNSLFSDHRHEPPVTNRPQNQARPGIEIAFHDLPIFRFIRPFGDVDTRYQGAYQPTHGVNHKPVTGLKSGVDTG